MKSIEIAQIAKAAAEDKKAIDVVIMEMQEVTLITDHFVIASASNITQVKAIADNIEVKLEEAGVMPRSREGLKEGRWILLDYGQVIVHVFLHEEREYYNLEKLWGDAKVV